MSYKILLVDLPSVYYRAFYALPQSITDQSGAAANAIKGSMSILAKVAQEHSISEMLVCLDADWRPTWRVELIGEYKSQRVDPENNEHELTPDNLSDQVDVLLAVLIKLEIPLFFKSGYEADDALATLASSSKDALIVTGDRDLFQLIDQKKNNAVYLLSDKNNPIYDQVRFESDFNFSPKNYLDYAVLRGDPSDGLPGVKGVGKVAAQKFVSAYGNIENILDVINSKASNVRSKQEATILAAKDYLFKALKVSTAVADLSLEQLSDLSDSRSISELTDYYKIDNQVQLFTRQFQQSLR